MVKQNLEKVWKEKAKLAKRKSASGGIKFDDDQFDLVWAGDVLEHVFDPMYLLKEIRRVFILKLITLKSKKKNNN